MNKTEKAYSDFFKVLKVENPQAYNDFMVEEKMLNICRYKEISCEPKRINYLVDKYHSLELKKGDYWIKISRAKLTDRQAEVFDMYYVKEYVIEDVANMLNCTVNNVYKIIQKINQKLS